MQAPAQIGDWERLRHDIRRLVGRRVASDADAEDVAQEVLLRIWRHGDSLRDGERFAAWVHRIVDTALADHLRARQRHPLLHADAGPELASPAGDEASQDRSIRPLVAAVLRPFAETLSPPYRDAIILSDLEGLPHALVAERLGISVSGVKSRVQRAREQIRTLLVRCCELALDARRAIVDCQPRPDSQLPEGCCEPSVSRQQSD